MKRLFGLTAAICLAAPVMATAQVAEGVYIGGGVGLNYHQDSDIEGVRLNGEAEFDLGFAVMGSVGYSFGGPRIEGELSYRRNGTDKSNVANAGTSAINTTPGGEFETVALMANFLYDIDIDTVVTPYLGAGVGGAYAAHEDVGDSVVFAYQAILGASFLLTDNLDAFVDYRFMGTTKVDGGRIGRAADIDNLNHTLMVGLRYNFGEIFDSDEPLAYNPPPPAPPPPPVARPAPVVAAAPVERAPAERRFLVFFDFDSAQIAGEGAQIVRDAAEASRVVQVTRIDVTGHADRAGGARYNERLSRRRALAVQRQLVAEGVPEKDIVIYARGEEDNLVPTRDGVREPRNRRVEIVLN